jgi:putative acetyltransferase
VAIIRAARREGSVLWEAVAECDGSVMGHILFTRMSSDPPMFVAALGPVSADPTRQRAGIGSALIREGLQGLEAMGVAWVFLLGHASYYPRFGFSAELARGVASPYAGSRSFMALALGPARGQAPPRQVAYPPAFDAAH